MTDEPVLDPAQHLQQVLAALSHDLKDPLTVIRAQAQVLERRYAVRLPPEDAPRFTAGLDRIQEEVRRLARWIDGLSDVTRLQFGQHLPLDPLPVDLVALVHRVVAEQARATDVHRIVVHAPAAEVTGHWDEARVERVLLNLLSNAVKYSPDGGAVAVSIDVESVPPPPAPAGPAPAWAVIRVADHGIGIPAGALDRLFEPYFRAPNALTATSGSGLGLFSVRHVVRSHGGTVGVDSREGQGTTVTVRLPLRAPAPSGDATARQDPQPGARRGGDLAVGRQVDCAPTGGTAGPCTSLPAPTPVPIEPRASAPSASTPPQAT